MISRKKRSEISIKRKILAYIAAFTLFMLIIVWVFQVVLLGMFYESTKSSELDHAADKLSENVRDLAATEELAARYSSEYQMFIRIFTTNNGLTEEVVRAHVIGNYYIRTAERDELSALYSRAENSAQKTYFWRRTVTPPENENEESAKSKESQKEMICVRVVEGEDYEYVIMLNIIYTPLNATVRTLMKQFSWIAIILLGGAVVLAAFMSRGVSKPIIEINEEAKKLGRGNFDVSFPREGYLESQELADTLNFAAAELGRTENLKKELIANLSHDLRTPLTMITGYGEVIRDIPGENTPENIQVIIDESAHLTELVNDLLDLSKIQSGNIIYEYEIFDLTESIRAAMQRYKKFTERDGFELSFEADSSVLVRADRVRILQVVYNLINNAMNYSGEVKRIEVTQTVSDGKVRISVSDQGEGIPQEALPDIWDRYYKVDRIHRRAMIGTGLGLSIVKGILEGHGATYGVESALGKGSTFWFDLSVCHGE